MKAFGVRLAAGALTILFGAYAAALAQKDKQENPDSWAAGAPTLGQPAAPIADIEDDSWISQPDSAESSADKTAPIQLVQHTESASESTAEDLPQGSFGIGALPANFAGEGPNNDQNRAELADIDVPDWTNLPEEDATATTTDAPAAMTFPGQPVGGAQQANGKQQQKEIPELEIGGGPAGTFADPAFETVPADGPATAALSPPTAIGQPQFAQPDSNSGSPNNILRDAATGANQLRTNPNNYADQPSDPTPMETWDSQNALPDSNTDPAPQPFVPNSVAGQLPVAPTPASPTLDSSAVNASAANPLYQQTPATSMDAAAAQLMPMNDPSRNQPVDFQQPARSVAINPNLSIDAPGDRRLEGAQTPSVVIQKRAPSEVKVGQQATFAIHVQNVGAVEALEVRVHDKIPSGMELVDASPRPVQQGNALLWELGAMPAGDEQTITMQLVPRQEGELGSVARVSFEAAASVRTIATRPELKIVQNAPETVLIGQQLEIELEVSNPGTGEATNVVLQEDVPQGLEHPKGRQLDNAIGNLAPGEIRRQVLRMQAVAPGLVQNTIRLTGDDGLLSEHTVNVQIVAPELKVELEGPSRRFLERQATYYVHIGNVGTADAHNVELSVQLDRGFTFVSTENQGQYDPSRHSVHWSLAQMPAGGNGKVGLTLLPVQEGEQAITLDARADLGVIAKNERRLLVEGFAELSFSITNPGGPIELGSETNYEIRVNNSGSKADSNIRVQLQLPSGLELVGAQGDAQTDDRGLVAFGPLSTLSPGTDHAYKIRVRGVAPGTHIVRAVVASDLATTPVTKEESTVVYADQ